jgi:hypothetical protein
MITRYSPASKEVDTGIGTFTELFMEKDAGGYYVNRLEVLAGVHKLLENACDPGEFDALNNVIKMLEAQS